MATNAGKVGIEAHEKLLLSINDLLGNSEMWCQFMCCISVYGVVEVLLSNLRRLLREFRAENIKSSYLICHCYRTVVFPVYVIDFFMFV